MYTKQIIIIQLSQTYQKQINDQNIDFLYNL